MIIANLSPLERLPDAGVRLIPRRIVGTSWPLIVEELPDRFLGIIAEGGDQLQDLGHAYEERIRLPRFHVLPLLEGGRRIKIQINKSFPLSCEGEDEEPAVKDEQKDRQGLGKKGWNSAKEFDHGLGRL